MATLIKPNGDRVEIELPPTGSAERLRVLQDAVGGYIEAVYGPNGRVMFVNDWLSRWSWRAKIKLKGLPPNEHATQLLRTWRVTNDVIVGDALVLTEQEAREEREEPEEA
jgi:hypothetical protein